MHVAAWAGRDQGCGANQKPVPLAGGCSQLGWGCWSPAGPKDPGAGPGREGRPGCVPLAVGTPCQLMPSAWSLGLLPAHRGSRSGSAAVIPACLHSASTCTQHPPALRPHETFSPCPVSLHCFLPSFKRLL